MVMRIYSDNYIDKIEMMLQIKRFMLRSNNFLRTSPVKRFKLLRLVLDINELTAEEYREISRLFKCQRKGLMLMLEFLAFRIGYNLKEERVINPMEMIFISLLKGDGDDELSDYKTFIKYKKEFNV